MPPEPIIAPVLTRSSYVTGISITAKHPEQSDEEAQTLVFETTFEPEIPEWTMKDMMYIGIVILAAIIAGLALKSRPKKKK